MRKTVLYIFVLLSLAGCVKKTDWPISGELPGVIAVDGILTDESRVQQITLNYPVGSLNETPVPVSGATVVINNEDSTWQMTEEPANSGIYRSIKPFIALSGENYSLLIYFRNNLYSAKATMTPGTLFNPPEYVKNDGNGLYHIDFLASAFDTQSAAMWEIFLDWSKVPGYEQADSLECKKRLLFYTLPTLDVSEIFAPGMEEISFPAGTSVIEKRYSLSPGHAEFIRSMLLETNWQGGLFCSAPANVPTNLSSGAVGYFGVCGVTELRFPVIP